MFIREVKTKNLGNDKKYINYKLVQSTRVDGEPRQQIILSLGNLSNLVRYKFLDQSLEKIAKEIDENEVVVKLQSLKDSKFVIWFILHMA